MKVKKKKSLNKDEAKVATKKKPQKQKATVNVDGGVRATKNGKVATVDPHTRVVDKNVDDKSGKSKVDPEIAAHMKEMGYDPTNSAIADAFDKTLSTAPVAENGIARLEDHAPGERNVTENMKLVTFKGKDGKTKKGFFKGIKDDPFVKGRSFLRHNMDKSPHITLNTKDNRALDKQDHQSIQSALKDKTLPDGTKKTMIEGKKGQMVDRELATVALGKMLKMDHVAEGAVRNIEIDGKQERGFVSGNLKDQFGESGSVIKKGAQVSRVLDKMSRTDPKFGDKVMFDYMTGNTDRHGGNFFVKQKNGKTERLDFDHGLTFGNDNKSLMDAQHYGYNGSAGMWGGPSAQGAMREYANKTKVSKEFSNNLAAVLKDAVANKGGKFTELTSFIEERIGLKEANAFKERFGEIAEGVLGKNAKSLGVIHSLKKKA